MSKGKKFGRSALTFLVAMLTLVWSTAAFAQLNTSKIEGIVRDKDTGQPLVGAQVTVEGTRLGNVTNADGYYFILNVPPGRKSITFTYTGYQKTTIANQLILAGQTITLDAGLSSTIIELEGITIEGEAEILMPRDQTATKQRMTSASIAESPATKLEDLMILEAGVQVGGEDALARGLRIRGGRLGEEGMVVDGIAVRNFTAEPSKSGIGWEWEQEIGSLGEDTTPLEFSTVSVEEVDIITGGFQAEYGNAQSGIVNIVTKEGGATLKGSIRITSDELNPRMSDYGYNQLQANVGGPVPAIPDLFFHVSGEIQGKADRTPTHGSEGFRGVDQTFVDRLNHAVRNDPVLSVQLPAPFTLEDFQKGREFYASKVEYADASLFSPENPLRLPGNWGDRTLASGKLTYSPIKQLRVLATSNFSRVQNSYPTRNTGNYFQTGVITSDHPYLYKSWNWDKYAPETSCYVPQSYGRRTRTSNLLLGFNWDFYQSAARNLSLQYRFNILKTQDLTSSSLKTNYTRDNTFMGWTPHDIQFELETYPNREYPTDPAEFYYYPDGENYWQMEGDYETPFMVVPYGSIYWLTYMYLYERQYNNKLDVDFQINRTNRAKIGVQYTNFSNLMFEIHGMSAHRDEQNEFRFSPKMYAWYVQNRTDLGDFVIDYGIRYDSFDPVENWGFRNGDQYGENYFPKTVRSISPRFSVAFPVTDKSQLRFAYGVFTQLPNLTFIYSGAWDRAWMGNQGGLEFSRTDAFEAGLSYLLSHDMVMDMVAYYRDVDGNIADKEYFMDYWQYKSEKRIRQKFTGYSNRDNGNIKGVDFTLKQRFANNLSFNLMYTLQFSRTTGSQYNSTSGWDAYVDPSTGAPFVPPDEIRPINGDVTHKFTAYFNHLFPEDFQAGTMANKILKNFRTYAILTLQSGEPLHQRVKNVTYLTERNGQPIGGLNYFRGRWKMNLDLKLSKTFYLGSKRITAFGEIFNVFNRKINTPYPTATYEGHSYTPTGGVDLTWSDDLDWYQKARFNADFNQDGILTVMEAAKGSIANSIMMDTMDKQLWGLARQVRLGLGFAF